MNTLASHSITNPYGKVDECAKFSIDDISNPFVLSDITTIDKQYVFSVWLRSDSAGSLTVCGTNFPSSAEWAKYETNFIASETNLSLIFGTKGTYYLYCPLLELGTVATDWTPSPEDSDQSIYELVETTKTMSDALASLSINADNVSAQVQSIERTTTEILDGITSSIDELNKRTEVIMDKDSVRMEIQQEMINGTGKVVTSTGYRFDDEGMTVSKSDSAMTTQITENGMTVRKNGEDTLIANSDGVDAVNLHATTYLIVGSNSRFEDYGEGRTGCFWIGG